MPGKYKVATERRVNHVKTFLSKPANVMLLVFGITLTVLTLIPLLSILREMFVVHVGIEKTMTGLKTGEFTLYHWKKLIFDGGDWSRTTFWEPLLNSFFVGLGGAVLGIGIGGTVAWLLARSNIKCKKVITSLFMFPYIMPAWTLALFWLNLFRNSNLGGGNMGLVQALFGVCMPEWFVYGLFPCIIVTGLHFAPFAYILIGGILQNMDATLEESATILKASRMKILRKITLPIVMPAVLSTFLLVFSSGFASYTAPVFLGGAVKFYTLASKMKSLMNAGYNGTRQLFRGQYHSGLQLLNTKEVSLQLLGLSVLLRSDEEIELVSEDTIVGIRPESLPISDTGRVSAMAYSTLPAGMETTVKIAIDGQILSSVVFGAIDYGVDEPIKFDFSGDGICLFDKSSGNRIAIGSIEVK